MLTKLLEILEARLPDDRLAATTNTAAGEGDSRLRRQGDAADAVRRTAELGRQYRPHELGWDQAIGAGLRRGDHPYPDLIVLLHEPLEEVAVGGQGVAE